LSSDGKTRILINDAPVTVAGLKKLGETLVEVHGQHDQRALQDTGLHRELLDDYAALSGKRRAVAEAYRTWRAAQSAMESVQAEIEKTAREQEYLKHMRGELKQLAPEPGEEEILTTERNGMMQSEKFFGVLNESIAELNAGKGVVGGLRAAQRLLTRSPLTA